MYRLRKIMCECDDSENGDIMYYDIWIHYHSDDKEFLDSDGRDYDDASDEEHNISVWRPLVEKEDPLPFLSICYRKQPVRVDLHTGSHINIVDYSFASQMSFLVYPISSLTRTELGNQLPASLQDEIHKGLKPFKLDALVVDHHYMNITGGYHSVKTMILFSI